MVDRDLVRDGQGVEGPERTVGARTHGAGRLLCNESRILTSDGRGKR